MATVKHHTSFSRWLSLWVTLALIFAACAPAAPAPSGQEATLAAAGAEVTLRFGLLGINEQCDVIASELQGFQGANAELVQCWTSWEQFMGSVTAGEVPDVVGGIWHNRALDLQRERGFFRILDDFLDGEDVDAFLPSAQRAVTLNESIFALPWRRYLCHPAYTVLGITQASANEPVAVKLIKYLTDLIRYQPDQSWQEYNFTQLRWYPTRWDANESVTGCQDNDKAYIARDVPPEQREIIRKAIWGDVAGLEEMLRNNGYWPEDQPTTFNIDWATGIVDQGETVRAGAVPVTAGDSEFFLESNLGQYFVEHGGWAYVVIGALRVYDESAIRTSPGTYAAVWEAYFDGADWTEERFFLVDENGNEKWEGRISDLSGTQVNEPEMPAFQVVNPFVELIEGSWFLKWLFDSRGGWIP